MNKKIKFIVYSGIFLALAVTFQMLHLPQYITGSFVNCVLLIATHVLGVIGGITIGSLTPWIAVITGHMPFPYMSPFIMIGNSLYVIIFSFLKHYKTSGYILGILIGSVIKFLWLSFSVRYLFEAPSKLIQMMSLPQLITALLGGFLAFILVKILPKNI